MTTMVRFRAAGTSYCVPVQATRSVRLALGMVSLPEPSPDIAGIVAGTPPLTVIAPLGLGGSHILVIEAGDRMFGLLVDAVTGLVGVADVDIGGIPDGQCRPLVCGTVDAGGELLLVADVTAMAGRL